MTADFDPNDRSSWYFGSINRVEATDLLMGEKELGVFLIRDSTSMQGDYVLCVREDSKVSHYIINKIQQNDQTKYRIGDQIFNDLPLLIEFYKLHYLDSTPLIRPVIRVAHTVIAKYDFKGNDSDDLPFKKGDVLTVISKDEEQWWTAKNSEGRSGSIPVPYVQKYEGTQQQIAFRESAHSNNIPIISHSNDSPNRRISLQKLPAYARVKQERIPCAYDKTALKLEVGDIIKVTKTNMNGQWEGELNGRVGRFPFTHVEFMDSDSNDADSCEEA